MTVDEAFAKMSVLQQRQLRCALNLYQLAFDIVEISRGETKDEAENIRHLCTAGALAESYNANLRELNDLLKTKHGGQTLSGEEVAAALYEQFDWIVSHGLKPAITRDPEGKGPPIPSAELHAEVIKARKICMGYRKVRNEKLRGDRPREK